MFYALGSNVTKLLPRQIIYCVIKPGRLKSYGTIPSVSYDRWGSKLQFPAFDLYLRRWMHRDFLTYTLAGKFRGANLEVGELKLSAKFRK